MKKGRVSLARRVGYRVWALPRGLRELDRSLLLQGSLRDIGWHRSLEERQPVDAGGRPLPWLTYPAIFWLDRVLRGTELAFEYGSGQSSLWLAERTRSVTSVEHDPEWAARVAERAPANLRVICRQSTGDSLTGPADDPYISAIADGGHGAFDLVLVDGRSRLSCVEFSLGFLKPGGLLILDNSDRANLQPAIRQLGQAGFAHLFFTGLAPANTSLTTTSLFTRDLAGWQPRRQDLPHWGSPMTRRPSRSR